MLTSLAVAIIGSGFFGAHAIAGSAAAAASVTAVAASEAQRTPGQTAGQRAREEAPTLAVIGLRVVAAPAAGTGSEFGAFSSMPGTTLSILLTQPGGGIIGFDSDRSRLDSFLDDQGGDLLKPDVAPRFSSSPFGMMPQISDDGRTMRFEVSAPGLAQRGASSITAKGALSIRVATKQAEHRHASVRLAAGTDIKAGPMEGKVKEVGDPMWGDAAMAVTLTFSRDIPELASVTFLDASGREIESSPGSSSRMSFGRSVTVDRGFNLSRKADVATIVFSIWTDLREVEVPFEVRTGVGLGG